MKYYQSFENYDNVNQVLNTSKIILDKAHVDMSKVIQKYYQELEKHTSFYTYKNYTDIAVSEVEVIFEYLEAEHLQLNQLAGDKSLTESDVEQIEDFSYEMSKFKNIVEEKLEALKIMSKSFDTINDSIRVLK